ncbi:DUF4112 domain-containing protein [Pedobacter sp. SYSU D00535]|uniref:DUF4112 domain-containing protein n=1 Tax=Pedobacter sp. SYSU D00535 TaxID=2810308 RepID=UPI001A97269B|nr:DUF4112 domain-containing protein [Pedobacter sp. SYSU D00535]
MTYHRELPAGSSPRLKWVEKLSYLLDEQFRIPGTRFRFGLDPIMNLVPFLGDVSGFVISAALVLTMAKNGASSRIVALMAVNIVLDATIGAIPIIGQIFDFFYKANSRNIRLLREHYYEGKHQGSGKGILIGVSIFLLVLFVLLLFALWKLIQWVFTWF